MKATLERAELLQSWDQQVAGVMQALPSQQVQGQSRVAQADAVAMGCRFHRGLKRKPIAFIKKLRAAKKGAEEGEKPSPVRTHLRNMIIVPEMIGSIVGVYNGKTFNQVGRLP